MVSDIVVFAVVRDHRTSIPHQSDEILRKAGGSVTNSSFLGKRPKKDTSMAGTEVVNFLDSKSQ